MTGRWWPDRALDVLWGQVGMGLRRPGAPGAQGPGRWGLPGGVREPSPINQWLISGSPLNFGLFTHE